MRYALLNKKIWKIIQEKNEQLLLERGRKTIEAPLAELDIIYPQLEAVELLEKCKPHIKQMESFGDIDELAEVDGNMLLPFSEEFSAADVELIEFLNATIDQTDGMIQAYPNRQEYKVVSLGRENLNNAVRTVTEAFNKTYPEANTLEIAWNDQHGSIYLCTQVICDATNLVAIPIDYKQGSEKKSKTQKKVELIKDLQKGMNSLDAGLSVVADRNFYKRIGCGQV